MVCCPICLLLIAAPHTTIQPTASTCSPHPPPPHPTPAADKSSIVWDAGTGLPAQQFAFHTGPVLDVDWASDTMFASASADRSVAVCTLGSSGGANGSAFPLTPPYGYDAAFQQLSPAILERSSILYIQVDPAESRLHQDLVGPGYHLNSKSQLVIESKESMAGRNIASPDDGDALALTFAMPVAAPRERRRERASEGNSDL